MIFAEPLHIVPGHIIAVIAIVMSAAVLITWIQARHGSSPRTPRPDRITTWLRALNGQPTEADDADRKIALLSAENEKLIGRIGRLEERIAVMERIVTDPGHATARAIEELR